MHCKYPNPNQGSNNIDFRDDMFTILLFNSTASTTSGRPLVNCAFIVKPCSACAGRPLGHHLSLWCVWCHENECVSMSLFWSASFSVSVRPNGALNKERRYGILPTLCIGIQSNGVCFSFPPPATTTAAFYKIIASFWMTCYDAAGRVLLDLAKPHPVPIGKPITTIAHNTSATSLYISWKPPPPDTILGEFLGYRITYRTRDKNNNDLREIYIRDSGVEVL